MENKECYCKDDVRNPGALPLLSLAPLQRDIIKIVAFLAMAGDHIATASVSYTHLTLPTNGQECRSRWSPYH